MKKQHKTALLVAVLLSAALTGIYFALSPALKQQAAQEKQAELLEQMEHGGGNGGACPPVPWNVGYVRICAVPPEQKETGEPITDPQEARRLLFPRPSQ